jgi:TonB family protein
MNESRAINRWILSLASIALAILPSALHAARSTAYIADTGIPSSAVDAKGVRHFSTKYPRQSAPWIRDRVKSFAPDYPYRDRAQRNEGTGIFRMTLDLKTGAVTRVTMVKSTGFATLDRSTIGAFRRWRWQPGKWKEIEMPIRFTMSPAPPRLPPGAIRIPSLGQ